MILGGEIERLDWEPIARKIMTNKYFQIPADGISIEIDRTIDEAIWSSILNRVAHISFNCRFNIHYGSIRDRS